MAELTSVSHLNINEANSNKVDIMVSNKHLVQMEHTLDTHPAMQTNTMHRTSPTQVRIMYKRVQIRPINMTDTTVISNKHANHQ